MPNSQGASWHKSNLNEYLAQCFLSALGVSAPVLRQEDIGIDFYCALSEEKDKRLTFDSPFTVQCGSEAGKEFVYGGFTDKGRWRREARDWLFAHQVPFFACTVSAKKSLFRLYQTSAKWMVRNECGHSNPTAYHLVPGGRFDPVKASVPSENIVGKKDLCEGSDGCSSGIPLREPVIELRVKDLTSKEKLAQARAAMRMAIEVERQNITHNHHLQIFASHWFTDIVPNDAAQFRTAYGMAYNNQANAHLAPLLSSLWNTSLMLALNLQAQSNEAAIEHLAPVFRLFGPQPLSQDVLQKLPKDVVAIVAPTDPPPAAGGGLSPA